MNSKKFIVSIASAILLILVYQTTYASETKVELALKEAEKLVDAEINRRIDPELIAMRMKIKYPPVKPEMQLKDIFKQAMLSADEELKKSDLAKRDEQLFIEISKKYSPIREGDKVTVITKLRYNNEITGRYHGMNRQRQVKIGSRWIRIQDLDDDTVARLDETLCDELIKKKFNQAKHKRDLEANTFRRKRSKEIAIELLKKNGYMPINRDYMSPEYLDVANWQTSAEFLARELDKEKENIREQLEESIVEKYMTDRGFQYDEVQESWFTPGEEKVAPKNEVQPGDNQKAPAEQPEAQPEESKQAAGNKQPGKKEGLFQKMKKLF